MNHLVAQREINEWCSRLYFSKGANALLPALQQRALTETDRDKLRALRLALAHELGLIDRLIEAEKLYRTIHDEFPDDPMPLICLASNKHYAEGDAQSALTIINDAIEIAHRSGTFRRFALGAKARIAHELKRYDLIEDVLRQLLDLKFSKNNFDCAVERDFFDRLPSGVIDKELYRRFDERFLSDSQDGS
jgi:tetratricopeptide (TPR) repeat protein